MTQPIRRQKHTVYKLMLGLTGMSVAEAALFHDVSLDSAMSWSSGRRQFPPGVIDELRALIAQQEADAARHLALIARGRRAAPGGVRDVYLLSAPDDDEDAKAMGYPCVGAWRAMAGRVVASSPVPVSIADMEPDNAPEMR